MKVNINTRFRINYNRKTKINSLSKLLKYEKISIHTTDLTNLKKYSIITFSLCLGFKASMRFLYK